MSDTVITGCARLRVALELAGDEWADGGWTATTNELAARRRALQDTVEAANWLCEKIEHELSTRR